MPISALFNLRSEVNTIHPSFAQKLRLPIRLRDVGAQKIDGTILNTYGIVVAAFSMTDKAHQVRFFKETFLMANINLKVVFEMLFFTLSEANIDFSGWELWKRTYTSNEAFSTTRRVKLVSKKVFAAAIFDPKSETFIEHVAFFSFIALLTSFPLELDVYLFYKL